MPQARTHPPDVQLRAAPAAWLAAPQALFALAAEGLWGAGSGMVQQRAGDRL